MLADAVYVLQIDGVEVATLSEVTPVGSGRNTQVIPTNNKDGIRQFTTVDTGAKEPEPINFQFYAGTDLTDPADKKNLEALEKWQKEGSNKDKRKNISVLTYHAGKLTRTDSYLAAFLSELRPPQTASQPWTGTICHNGKNEGAK
ncbi:hypothetical protein [Streptomyces sp. NPDC055709]